MDGVDLIIRGGLADPSQLDRLSRDRFAEFVGREPHATGASQMVYKIRRPEYPQFHFEWHPQTRKVWIARLGRVDDQGRFFPLPSGSTIYPAVLAEHANTHGEAYNFVQTYLRGFKEGRLRDITPAQGQSA